MHMHMHVLLLRTLHTQRHTPDGSSEHKRHNAPLPRRFGAQVAQPPARRPRQRPPCASCPPCPSSSPSCPQQRHPPRPSQRLLLRCRPWRRPPPAARWRRPPALLLRCRPLAAACRAPATRMCVVGRGHVCVLGGGGEVYVWLSPERVQRSVWSAHTNYRHTTTPLHTTAACQVVSGAHADDASHSVAHCGGGASGKVRTTRVHTHTHTTHAPRMLPSLQHAALPAMRPHAVAPLRCGAGAVHPAATAQRCGHRWTAPAATLGEPTARGAPHASPMRSHARHAQPRTGATTEGN
jgi:hypothetical protein